MAEILLVFGVFAVSALFTYALYAVGVLREDM